MSLLRICASPSCEPSTGQALHCQWVLFEGGESSAGEGPLTDLPQRAERIQLVLPAAQVLLTRARVPQEARHRAGPMLAFAVEEKMAGEPDANQVSWIGAAGDEAVLAITDKQGLERWQSALGDAGLRVDEVHCETLLLPIRAGEWSVAWNGRDGFVRTGEFEGAATDCGDRESPPLLLRLMLEEARARNATPTSIILYMTTPDAAPDIAAWQRELGMDLRIAEAWDWRKSASDTGVNLTPQRRRWRSFSGVATRLRPAAWMLGAALTLHALALTISWALLAGEQRTLRQQMEMRFRATFPDAVAVVNPTLQMRRKLAEARHAAGLSDSSDFLLMIELVAMSTKELPAGAMRAVSYEGVRMTLELVANEEAVSHFVARLIESGLNVEAPPTAARGTSAKTTLVLQIL